MNLRKSNFFFVFVVSPLTIPVMTFNAAKRFMVPFFLYLDLNTSMAFPLSVLS
ncbi:MAG: hypothetical protein ACYDAZ_08255 [Thermoplasmataceae archaeon]